MSNIANYAVSENPSRQRAFLEKSHPYRSPFERDRDRIIHSSAFRRLEGKTQVFTPGLDDHYRTRLTHSIEVTQIGKTIAKALGLNQNLTEAICLAHDLGHPPFGHTGEKILNDLTSDFGGFEHNRQTLRVVELLEHPYPDFPGLNLMYETRLGLARHTTAYDDSKAAAFTEPNCSLEGQLADISDRIAYNCHDLEDGMRAALISEEQLKEIPIFTQAQEQINAGAIKDKTVASTRTAKAIIDTLVSDCILAGKKKIADMNVKTIDDVYGASENLIVLSAESNAKLLEMENFLLNNLYLHKSITAMEDKIRCWLELLYKKFLRQPKSMPVYFQQLTAKEGIERTVTDYIAGMTDRFCLKTLEKAPADRQYLRI
jgi:dGTPase